jgi:site-specific DNA-methyltransferase (adenine-specific)
MKILDTRQAAIADLKPYPGNARTHNLDVITRSLERNGQYRAVVVQQKGMRILAGHGTVEAATSLGWDTVLAHMVACTAAEAKRIVLVDNRANDLAGYDQAGLAKLLETLDAPALDGTGYGADDVDRLLRSLDPDGGGRQTDPGARPAAPRSKPGRVVELGPHRLMCGDSTNPDQLAQLLGDARAQLVLTDPPYGVDYDGGTTKREKLAGDERGTGIYAAFLPTLAAAVDPKAALYLWHAGAAALPVLQALASTGWEVRAQIIWVKNLAQFGALSAQYHQQHEPLFYCHRRGTAPRWYGPKNEVTVWPADRAASNDLHPTQKPVELAERAISNSTQLDDLVLDPFGGSGSTLIACHNLGRRAYLMELDPGYCDVIVDRYERHVAGDG